MSTFVEYWAIGTSVPTTLQLTTSEISAHLLADWLPAVPSSQSRAFMGWPEHILQPVTINASKHLSLHRHTGQSERQWKAFISWMLAVAGTRQVLAQLGYRWIAPLSAFYPELVTAIAIPTWHHQFPRSRVTVLRKSGSASRLRPDYIAIRRTSSGSVEWAVAESKGTSRALSRMTHCLVKWRNQVENVQVLVNRTPLTIPRHIVVATRINPNAKRDMTRRLQIRAWNSQDPTSKAELPADAAAEVASAYLFGLFENLNLPAAARALAASVQARSERRLGDLSPNTRALLSDMRMDSGNELDQRLRRIPATENQHERFVLDLEWDLEKVSVEFDPATLYLARGLTNTDDPDAAAELLMRTDHELDTRAPRAARTDDIPELALPSGIAIQFPSRRLQRDA